VTAKRWAASKNFIPPSKPRQIFAHNVDKRKKIMFDAEPEETEEVFVWLGLSDLAEIEER